MKRLLTHLTPATIAITLLWSLASWSVQVYLGIPLWWSLLSNLFFGASLCLKYPAQGSQRNLTFSKNWMLIVAGAISVFGTLRWVKGAIGLPLWAYYLSLIFSIIILERVLIECKKLLDQQRS